MGTELNVNRRLVNFPPVQLMVALAVATLLLYVLFEGPMRHMASSWLSKEEYSHGILIPFIVAFFIWQKRDRLAQVPFTGSWLGVAVVVFGMLLSLSGNVSTIDAVIEYGFVLVLIGLALTLLGAAAFRIIMAPMAMLLFMVPLPIFIFNNLSAELQLISSAIGVWFIQLFDISVALQGNVIDLGQLKLQVVEACSGLRYLFPLMVFGFITAYLFKAALWKRLLVFVSTIPLTVIMNSLRIGVIGVTVEYWGEAMAEGFLHDFEGWVVFMICALVLGAEMWMLTRLTGDASPMREVFGLEVRRSSTDVGKSIGSIVKTGPFNVVVLVLALVAVVSNIMPEHEQIIPAHESFASFPLQIESWNGRSDRLDRLTIDELDVSDYLLVNYLEGSNKPINFYVAYYGSQRTGESAHSPRTCLPGGGWRITSLTQRNIGGALVGTVPLSVNRALIEMGDDKQLVYYWFQQRGRVITNEYLVKWYLFWDALTRNRTDGALVRVTTQVAAGDDIDQADQRLTRFVQSVTPRLNDHIPL